MRLHLVKRALPAIFIAATWWTGACSSDQKETEEAVSNSQGNQENANQGEAEGGNASENAIASTSEAEGNSDSGADASAAAEPPPSPEPAPPPAPEAPAPAPPAMAAPAPATTAAPAGDDIVPKPNRFVRYVQAASAVVRSEPSDGAATVVTLAKGDHILISEENGWGKIASGKFIKLSDLSHKAVPRDRMAPSWN